MYICGLVYGILDNSQIIVNKELTKSFKAIDFFCGGGGMTCGLRQTGIDVIAGVDFEGKEPSHDFENAQHWNLDAEYLEALKGFLEKNLTKEG